jgi:valyl-tRNA synthetase
MDQMDWLIGFVSNIRQIRSEMNISPKKKISVLLKETSSIEIERLKETQNYIQALGSVEAISILSDDDQEPVSATALLDGMKILIPLEGLIDIEDEKQRLQKNLAKIDKDIKSSKQRLLNKNFRSNAPQEIIDQLKTRLEHLIRDKTKIEDQFNRLSKG